MSAGRQRPGNIVFIKPTPRARIRMSAGQRPGEHRLHQTNPARSDSNVGGATPRGTSSSSNQPRALGFECRRGATPRGTSSSSRQPRALGFECRRGGNALGTSSSPNQPRALSDSNVGGGNARGTSSSSRQPRASPCHKLSLSLFVSQKRLRPI
jgi:hypothetical protein